MSRIVQSVITWLKKPDFGDPDQNQTAFYLQVIALLVIFNSTVIGFSYAMIEYWHYALIAMASAVFQIFIFLMVRRKHLIQAIHVFVFSSLASLTWGILGAGGIHATAATLYPVFLIFAGLLLNRKSFAIYTFLCIMSVGAIVYAENQKLTSPYIPDAPQFPLFLTYSLIILGAALLVRFVTDGLRDNLRQARQRERELAEQKEILASIFQALPDLYFRVGADGTIHDYRAGYAKSLYASPEQFLGKDLRTVLPVHAADPLYEAVRQALKSTEMVITEYELEVDEERQWFEARISPLDADQVVVIVRNINRRKKSETALRDSEAKFHGLFKHSSDAIFLADEDGRIVEWNQASEKITGLSRENVLGREIWDVQAEMMPDDAKRDIPVETLQARLRETISQALLTGEAPWLNQVTSGEMQLSSGELRYFQQAIFCVPSGDKFRLAGITRDITDQKRMNVQERRRQEMLEKVIQLGKVVTQTNTLEQCLREIHQAVQTGLGFDRAGLFLYDPETDLIWGTLGTDRDGKLEDMHWYNASIHVDKAWEEIINNPGGFLYLDNYSVRRADELKPAMAGVKEHIVISTWAGNQPVGFIAVDNLLTQRPFTPEQIEALQFFAGYAGLAIHNVRGSEALEERVARRTAELEDANQELESLSYTIAHDMRSPIRAMVGFTGMLQESQAAACDESAQKSLERIHSAALKMGCMVDDFLFFLSLGRKRLTKQEIDTNDLVKQVLNSLQADIRGRQIEFKIGILPNCAADVKMLAEVWQHLIENAIKFTRPRLQARIEIGAGQADGAQYYFVRDNGVGFDMKYSKKLFVVFNRLHLEEEFEGTGIGLAVVQRILHRHGGRIWVEAEVDKGATFFFTIG